MKADYFNPTAWTLVIENGKTRVVVHWTCEYCGQQYKTSTFLYSLGCDCEGAKAARKSRRGCVVE